MGKDLVLPTVTNISSDRDSSLSFRLKSDMSISNAIRRIILSDMPVVVINTETCIIEENTCGNGQHNEYLKHRLDCIPVVVPPNQMSEFVQKYYLRVDVRNETSQIKHVTTADFTLIAKEDAETDFSVDAKTVFPPFRHEYYIEFAHLRPTLGDTIPGGALVFTCDFKVSMAKENAAYNVVSKCTSFNTIDEQKVKDEWIKEEEQMKSEGKPIDEITLRKANFMALDSQRITVPDSYDFVIETLGMYDDREIVRHACAILSNKLDLITSRLKEGVTYKMRLSDTVMSSVEKNSFDIHLGGEDYTIGKVLEYLLFEYYYNVESPQLNFCAFKKLHPHDAFGVLRVGIIQQPDVSDKYEILLLDIIEKVCKMGVRIFTHIENRFNVSR